MVIVVIVFSYLTGFGYYGVERAPFLPKLRSTASPSKYTGLTGTVESDVHHKTRVSPDEFANGYHVMLDTEELMTVRRELVEANDPQ